MKKNDSLAFHIMIFVLAQLAWLALLGLWTYWYVSNYIIFERVGDQLSPPIDVGSPNVFLFVGGIVLIIAVAFGLSLIFRHLNVQFRLTRLYDNFISNVTHELKSPLSSIQLYLETLNSRYVPPEKQKEFLELMLVDATRLKNLINSILEISALEQKRIAHNFQIFNAEKIIGDLLSETIEQFQLSKDTIVINGNAPCKCVVDRNALKIVFDNLVDNAIKYSNNTVQITVNLKCFSKKLLIEFTDSGIGISPKDQKRIFNKFHRIYNKNIPNVKGTGLGLFWVKEILRHHGGKIIVSSNGEYKGSTFSIELPIYQSSKKRYINGLLKLTKRQENLLEAVD
jgi:signal transduction histidine kinase